MTPLVVLLLTATQTAPGVYGDQTPPEWDDCRIVHIYADGTRTVSEPKRPMAGSRTGSASAETRTATRGRTSNSSVSVSSSSHAFGGRSFAESRTTSGGRSITQTRDEGGCTVTIDERSGEQR